MTTDIQPAEHEDVSILPATDPSDVALDRMLRQAKAMQAAHQIGSALAATSMVPQHFQGKPDDAAAAIMHGNELGLPAIQSLQQIFVVRGKPAMYARAMVALIIAKGHRIFEVESSPTSVTWAGVRSDNGDEMTSTWTIERATTAGFTSNKLYETQPTEMLRAKAQSEVARNLFPDILTGMSAREDLELQDDERRRPVRVQSSVEELRARMGIAEAPKADTVEPAADPQPDAEPEAKKPTTAQNRRLAALFERAGLTKDDKAGRRIVFASFFPDRELGAQPSADETDHVIAQLEQLADAGDGDSVLVGYAEDVITQQAEVQS